MKHLMLAATCLAAAPALAAPIDEAGRYTCTSDEGWKYFYDVHKLEDSSMVYSRGHNNVLSGWETTCFGTGLPIFEFCRDMDRVDEDATSAPHARLRADCLPALGRYTCKLEGGTEAHVFIDRIEGNEMIGKLIINEGGATSLQCNNRGELHELADCPDLIRLEPETVSAPHDEIDAYCALEEKNQ